MANHSHPGAQIAEIGIRALVRAADLSGVNGEEAYEEAKKVLSPEVNGSDREAAIITTNILRANEIAQIAALMLSGDQKK